MSNRILNVEDDVIISEVLKGMFEFHGYNVAGVLRSSKEVASTVRETMPDLIVLDINLQGTGDGIDAAREIVGDNQPPIVFLTGETPCEIQGRIADIPRAVLLSKPVSSAELIETAKGLLEKDKEQD